MRGLIKKHYHWVIAFVVLLEMTVYIGFINNYTSLYIIPVSETFQISRSVFSLVVSTKQVIAFISTLFSGFLFAKFGYRALVFSGLLLGASGYFLLSSAQTPSVLFLGAGIMGLLEYACSTAGASRIISTWFYKYRGTILGVVTAFSGIGGSLFCIVLNTLILQYGWRTSYIFCSVCSVLLAVLMLIVIRNRPADVGLDPYGLGYKPQRKKISRVHDDHWLGFTPKEVVRRPTFYLMILCTLLSCLCMYAAYNVLSPHLQDRGLTSSQAASMQSVMLLCLALAKFLCGVLSDCFGPRVVTLLCVSANAVGLILLATTNSMISASIAVAIFAWALPASTITVPLLAPTLFGYQSNSYATGFFFASISLACVFATPIANLFYDRIGSYSPLFLACAVVCVGLLALYGILFALADRDKKRYYIGEIAAIEES